MSGQRQSLLRLVALNNVLDRLGENIGSEPIQVLKSALFHELSTTAIINADLVSVEIWHKNLQKIIGKDAAVLIMQDFYVELDRISAKVDARAAVFYF